MASTALRAASEIAAKSKLLNLTAKTAAAIAATKRAIWVLLTASIMLTNADNFSLSHLTLLESIILNYTMLVKGGRR